ncbi:MAG TPA: glutathione S-transferase [Burkholderiaceae bacterium]|nr:glutathione S-transferase [Burkholderiaceae bacterium]
MYKLYGSQGSGSAAVEAAMAIAGVDCALVEAATWSPGPGLDELRRINPLAQIPTLVAPDGSILTESAAILIHLGLEFPGCGLLPASAAAQAQAIRGLVYIAANCYAMIGVIDYPERLCADADEALRERLRDGARHRLHALWDAFVDQFPATPFLGGAAPGALDVLAAVVSRWSGARPHLAQTRPRFADLLQRIDTTPRIAAIFQRHWPADA